jgi:hypothetical protein
MARIVDISSNNADPDFRRLRRSGVAGVYIKASEGTSYTNPHAKRCYDAAGGGRLARGFYHFARPDQNPGAAGARREAQHFVSVMRSMHGGRHACKRGNLVPVLDYEVRPAESDWRDAFMDEVWKLCGHEVMLYTSPGFNQWTGPSVLARTAPSTARVRGCRGCSGCAARGRGNGLDGAGLLARRGGTPQAADPLGIGSDGLHGTRRLAGCGTRSGA